MFRHQTLTKNEWKRQLSDFTEIFYELRTTTPHTIEDDTILEAIDKKIEEFDNDLARVAGYFETNFVIEGGQAYE